MIDAAGSDTICTFIGKSRELWGGYKIFVKVKHIVLSLSMLKTWYEHVDNFFLYII
jgi:hypothetical protein